MSVILNTDRNSGIRADEVIVCLAPGTYVVQCVEKLDGQCCGNKLSMVRVIAIGISNSVNKNNRNSR